MKKYFCFCVFIVSLTISHSIYAQQEEYAFMDVSLGILKATVGITKNGESVKYTIKREETGSLRVGITKLMNELNKEGYQLFSMNSLVMGSDGSLLNEVYIFIRKTN